MTTPAEPNENKAIDRIRARFDAGYPLREWRTEEQHEQILTDIAALLALVDGLRAENKRLDTMLREVADPDDCVTSSDFRRQRDDALNRLSASEHINDRMNEDAIEWRRQLGEARGTGDRLTTEVVAYMRLVDEQLISLAQRRAENTQLKAEVARLGVVFDHDGIIAKLQAEVARLNKLVDTRTAELFASEERAKGLGAEVARLTAAGHTHDCKGEDCDYDGCPDCECPDGCDCEAPDASPAMISNLCPVHNLTTPACDCPCHQPDRRAE